MPPLASGRTGAVTIQLRLCPAGKATPVSCSGPLPEGVHAVSVDFGHRAGGAELEIAGDESHADWITGTQRLAAIGGGRCRVLTTGPGHHGEEALFTKRVGDWIDH